MIDVNLPVVTRDDEGSPIITLTSTKDGKKHVTSVDTYHGMSDAHLAAMAKVVDAFFAKEKHVGLSDKEFGHWEDKAYEVLKKFRESGHGTGR